MAAEVERLSHHEHQHQAHAAEHLEVDPGVGVEVEGHPQVKHAHAREEQRPGPAQGAPDGVGQFHLGAHQRLDEVLAKEQLPASQDGAHQPVQDRGLPLDEFLVVGDECGAAKKHDDRQADPLHGLDLAVAQPQVGDLHHRGGDRHAGGDIDARELEGREEQDDGEKVDQQFHKGYRFT